jgi:hypothetical protein
MFTIGGDLHGHWCSIQFFENFDVENMFAVKYGR